MPSLATVFADRLLGFIALILMAVLAFGLLRNEIQDPYIDLAVYGALGLLIVLMVLLLNRKIASALGGLFKKLPFAEKFSMAYHELHEFKRHRVALFLGIALSFIAQCSFILTHYLVVLSLGAEIIFWKFFILVPVVIIVSMAPSISGLGVREAAMVYLFGLYLTTEQAIALSVLMGVIIYGFSLAGGIWYIFKGGFRSKISQELKVMETA